jgi:diguanylate cyclase (GGDEF)-like protein/PAS domain S-box-containing protein
MPGKDNIGKKWYPVFAVVNGRNRVLYFLAGAITVMLIGALDLATGYNFAFSIFYLAPIILAASIIGKDEGILLAVLSGIVWLTADVIAGNPYATLMQAVWNAFVRTFFFLLPVYMVEQRKMAAALKKYDAGLESLVEKRTCQIHDLYKQIEFVLGSTGTGLDIIDSDYNIVYVDPEWEKKYGSPKGKKCYEYFMGRNNLCPNCGVRKAIETKRPVVSEEVLVREGNRPVRVITTPYQDDSGRWLVAEVNVDITKEKEAEKELLIHQTHLEDLVKERTRQFEESEKKFRLAFENALDAIVWADPHFGVILNCNKAAEDLFEMPRKDLIGKPQTMLHPRDQEGYYSELFKAHAKDHSSAIEAEIVTGSGKTKTVLISASSTQIKGNMVMQGIFHDITKRKAMEKAHQVSEENYRSIFESANDAIIVRDIKTYKVIDANNKACEMFRYSKEEVKGMTLQAMLAENLPHRLSDAWVRYEKAAKGEPQLFETIAKDKLGRTFYVEISLKRAIIGDKYQLLALVRDVTERKDTENRMVDLNKSLSRANESLKRMALVDSHTGLYNHRHFVSAIESEFERSKRLSEDLSVIMIDIDYFKSINDVYGHPFGDIVLKQFSRLIKSQVRVYDVVVRFGGEEFIIIAPNTGKREALTLAHRMMGAITAHNFGDKKHSVKIKASAAVCTYPHDKSISSSADFINTADKILEKVKEAGGNRVYSLDDLGKAHGEIGVPQQEPTVDELKEKINRLTARGNQSVIEAIFAFAKTIELKDRYTGDHVEKTIHYSATLARSLGLPSNEIETIKEASILHDLGKVGISESILLKPGKLTKREREIIQRHPQIGVDIIRPLHFLRELIPIIRHHHEWWNGKGYPDKLKKESIPIGARIVAIADVYQALTSDRPYHKAYPKEEAIRIIKNGSGTQFDPRIVEAFLDVVETEA